ncbi:speckle-type POZ protein B-like [Trichogramma pretiosum]|uniref:speckle-type POZ protein B-like n=1 Tax=Trichogramma pretiosum TaxID=7493 RepID=UPI0006C94613|nr:speckle-type POZ protein B-like [Trichogramma pretiosum]
MHEVIGLLDPLGDNTINWTMQGDLRWLLRQKKGLSRKFCVDADDKKKIFQMKLCKGATTLDDFRNPPEYRDVWRLSLCCIDENSSIMWNYKISIFKDNAILHSRTHDCTFSMNRSEEVIFIVLSDEIDQLIPRIDELKISCQLEYIKENTDNSLKDKYDDTIEDLRSKFNNEWIFLNENLSDVKLRTASEKEIPAHKVVLAMASPVFKAMFSNDMLEKKSQTVDMNDISYDAAVEMLRYIYIGSVETQEFSLTAEVLAAAEKYQLEELKNKCERIICSNLTTENAVQALRIADMYSAKHLKNKTVDFVRRIITGTSDCDEISDMILDKAKLASK